jgi:predicted ATPase
MYIESISIKNYKTLQNVTIKKIPALCVLVGANGTGKTTLFDVFGFLKDALAGNVSSALKKRGGFKEVVTRGYENENIEIALQFRLEINEVKRLVTYELSIKQADKKIIIEKERLRYKRGRHGHPYHFINFSGGKGFAITNEEDFNKTDDELDREAQSLDSPDILAIKGLGQFQRFKAANAFRQFIESWHLSDFHINEARPDRDVSYTEHLSPLGDNIANYAQFLYEQHRSRFDNVLEKMKKCVPGVRKIEAEETKDGRILLKFQDGAFKDPFIQRYVSDGTIKMFAYLLLLHDPAPHPLLCIEEPENQLYPHLFSALVNEFYEYQRRGGQVILSTHSPDLLDELDVEDILLFKKVNGITQVTPASDDNNLVSLLDAGDSLGALWRQGLFSGVNEI